MSGMDGSARRAARALGGRLASVGRDGTPRRASFTDVGTVERVMADGTALVSYRGGTIGPLPMTCDCVGAEAGRACVLAIDGPIVRVVGIVARSSSDFAGAPMARLLWEGKTQGAVTLPVSCASVRAISVGICGADGVVEATTTVWSPDGKTFDVCAAFVVGAGDWRSMRVRISASGSTLTPTLNLGQTSSGSAGANAYVCQVHGII